MYVCVASFPGSPLALTNNKNGGPGSPLPSPFLFFIGARGEPGNKANMCVCVRANLVSTCQNVRFEDCHKTFHSPRILVPKVLVVDKDIEGLGE